MKLNKPITIEVETVEDAVGLAHRMNYGNERMKIDYGIPSAFTDVSDALYRKFKAVLESQGIDYTTWQPPQPLLIGTHKAEVQPDGSVQIGCTRVDRETIKAVMKLSDEAVSNEPEWPKYVTASFSKDFAFWKQEKANGDWELINLKGESLSTVSHEQFKHGLGSDGRSYIPAAEAKAILKK